MERQPLLFKNNNVVLGLVLVFFALAQILTAFLLVRALSNIHWYWTGPRLDLTDFSQFYQAGQLIVSPNSHHIYDPDVQENWCLGLIYPQIPIKGLFYNQSVPFLYVFCIPYGLLPYNISYVVWCLSTGLMSIVALWLLLQKSLQGLKGRKIFAFTFLCLAYASIPAYLTVWHGQTTFLLVCAMSLCLYFYLCGKDVLSGIALALSTVKPQYILLPLATMAGLAKWRLVIALFIAEASLFALAACFMGVENIIGYPKILVNAESSTRFCGVNPHVMASLRGLLSVLMVHKTAMLITCLSLFASLIPTALWAKSIKASGNFIVRERFILAFTYTLALVLSPHSHYFDCLLLTVPAALTMRGLLIAKENGAEENEIEAWRSVQSNPWYHFWCKLLFFYPLLSWIYNFCLGSMEAEGIAFLITNVVLTISLAGIIKSTGPIKIVEKPLENI